MKRRKIISLLAVALWALPLAAQISRGILEGTVTDPQGGTIPAAAQAGPAIILNAQKQIWRYGGGWGDLVLAPSGKQFATIESRDFPESLRHTRGTVVLRATATGAVRARFDPCATCSYGGLAWSRSSDELAFIASDNTRRTSSVYVLSNGSVRKIASINGVASSPRWSPDGTQIAVLAIVGARKLAGEMVPGIPLVGEISATPDEQRLAVVPAAGGPLRLVSPPDTYVFEYDWCPKGDAVVATTVKGDGDSNWFSATLDAIDIATGQIRTILRPTIQIAFPRISSDGKTVAFLGGLMSDFAVGALGGDVYLVPFAGGEPANITPGVPTTFNSIVWRQGRLLATALQGDGTAVFGVDPDTHAISPLWSDTVSTFAGDGRVSFSADGSVGATQAETFERGPMVLAGPVGSMRPVTHDNDRLKPLVSAQSITWTNDGLEIQGWLLGPRTPTVGKTYPLIVEVHGGPAYLHYPSYPAVGGDYASWVAHGYYVLLPNPRGSLVKGESFTRANEKDFGGGDFRDIVAGIDAAAKSAPIDGKRVGIIGISYGGYMAMWAATHPTQRFKAAVAGAGIFDYVRFLPR
jgi:dipeptidyl aminopeptidase/acylaminoacyl peptidase